MGFFPMGYVPVGFRVFAYFKIRRLPAYDVAVNANPTAGRPAPRVSLGIIAWNEEEGIGRMLESLFQQSLFAELSRRGQTCEIICVANGCTDRTPEVAGQILTAQMGAHPYAGAFSGRVMNVQERGKLNAWNRFVHQFSARDARFLFLMDADILIHGPDTLWNMLQALERNGEATVATDRPCKDIQFKARKTPWDRLSLGAARMTGAAEGQLCGQLYCIRSDIARNIYLPRDLGACEDGFIKALVCTDFLTHHVWPWRIVVADNAEHTFEAYTSPAGVFKNQKRQMIGQTVVHILVDGYLKSLPLPERARLADTLRVKEQNDPDWLKRLVAEHVRRTKYFWRLYPGLLSHRFRRLANLNLLRKAACLPSALAGFVAAVVSSFMASRLLKSGATNYWPRADRAGFKQLSHEEALAQR